MCGILALLSVGPPRLSEQIVRRSLNHRGPDACGYQRVRLGGKLLELGHTRLAIRELTDAGAQPMWSRDGRWLLAYNGELYNNERLRERLAVDFRGSSDTETLVELIAAAGIEHALERINGMFAFVAFDRETGTLHAARDQSGIKPLYFFESGDTIGIASEIRCFTDNALIERRIDPDALSTYLRIRYVPSSRTLLEGVRRVPPGGLISWSGDRRVERAFCYAAAPAPVLPGGGTDPVARFGEIFEDAVRRQRVSDVPIGVLLSGGTDSALVAAALQRDGVRAPCFTVGFADDSDASEIDAARQTAQALGLPHHALRLTAEELIGVSGRVSAFLEEPLGTTSVLAMWHLCELARRHVTVALSGQGADEPLGGYRRHRFEALRERLPVPVAWMLAAISARLPASMRSRPEARLLAALGERDWLRAYLAMRTVFGEHELAALGLPAPVPASLDALAHRADAASASECARALWLDCRTQLADDLLLYSDKLSMAHSLELRVPFLDAEVLAFLERLPTASRVTPRRSKRILLEYARRRLPPQIVARKKKGFPIPNLFRDARFLQAALELVPQSLGSGSG
ncbi:MAG TPA: asparagine synthase (glutamine-hydrolyzing), partial [Burkholderiaceae bacterium]|nr:asparagine synthase (glutamine-hydrolyzing) [Burkholderiaceae bacterium]